MLSTRKKGRIMWVFIGYSLKFGREQTLPITNINKFNINLFLFIYV